MARDIDEIIDYIRRCEHISPVERRVLINRIEPRPTPEERERAKREVGYP